MLLHQEGGMEHSVVGQWLGWLMATIYMGGRIPQIYLNVIQKTNYSIFHFRPQYFHGLLITISIVFTDQARERGGKKLDPQLIHFKMAIPHQCLLHFLYNIAGFESFYVRLCIGCQCCLCWKVSLVFCYLYMIHICIPSIIFIFM